MKPRRRRWTRVALGVGGAALGLGAVTAIILSLLSGADGPKRAPVHNVTLLRPPPPPPPPKAEEKPPEPELKKEEVKVPQPETPDQPADNQPPAGEQLGLDAEGGAGGDGFGLAARKGGRDITSLGAGGFGGFAATLQRHLQDELAKQERLRREDYRAVIKLWIAPDGSIQRYELAASTGNPATDEQLRAALSRLPPLRAPPPEEMPQPVRLRITSRSAG